MTTGYAYISIIALVCYLFLFLTFTAAKKNKLINIFMLVLVCMILWTGGSFAMRALLWPGHKFWDDISILGLTLAPYAFFLFSLEFVGADAPFSKKIWLILALAANVCNILTSSLLAPPERIGVLLYLAGLASGIALFSLYIAAAGLGAASLDVLMRQSVQHASLEQFSWLTDLIRHLAN